MVQKLNSCSNKWRKQGWNSKEFVTHGRTFIRCELYETVAQLSLHKVDRTSLKMASVNVDALRGRAGENVEIV